MMIFDPLSFIYEGIYSARLLAFSSVFGIFFLGIKQKMKGHIFWLNALFILFYASFSPFVNYLISLHISATIMKPIHFVWYGLLPVTHFFIFSVYFEGSWSKKLFVYALGVLAECAFFGWFYLFYDVGIFTLREHTVYAVSTEIALSALTIAGVYFMLRRYTKENTLFDDFFDGQWFLPIATILIITFLRLQLQGVYELVKENERSWVISFTLGFVPILLSFEYFILLRYEYVKREGALLNQLLYEQAKQYKNSVENVEIINRKCHDLRKQLRALEYVSEAERTEQLKSITKSVNIYDSSVKTDNPALNAILNERGLTCLSKRIQFDKIIDATALAFIDVVDLYVLIGNMLDNAIEACEKVEEPDKKIISLNVRSSSGFSILEMQNYCAGAPVIKDGLPLTDKPDKDYHGFGVKSIRHIAEKYGGNMSVSVDENIFTILVAIPQIS